MKKNSAIIEPKDVFTGNAGAALSLVQFGDYESADAVKAHRLVTEILESYKGKVKFSFRLFPLRSIHQKAQKAAEAAVAAAQEGRFWEMHEMLLQNPRNLGTISLRSYAKEIGISNKRFLDELINGRYAWSVQDDLDEGLRLGVREIPAFFINGERIADPLKGDNLKAGVEAALQANG